MTTKADTDTLVLDALRRSGRTLRSSSGEALAEHLGITLEALGGSLQRLVQAGEIVPSKRGSSWRVVEP